MTSFEEAYFSASFSHVGARFRQWPHHGAKNFTKCFPLAICASNVASVNSTSPEGEQKVKGMKFITLKRKLHLSSANPPPIFFLTVHLKRASLIGAIYKRHCVRNLVLGLHSRTCILCIYCVYCVSKVSWRCVGFCWFSYDYIQIHSSYASIKVVYDIEASKHRIKISEYLLRTTIECLSVVIALCIAS